MAISLVQGPCTRPSTPCGRRAILKKNGASWAEKCVNITASLRPDDGRWRCCARRSVNWWGKYWTKDRSTMKTHNEDTPDGRVEEPYDCIIMPPAGLRCARRRAAHSPPGRGGVRVGGHPEVPVSSGPRRRPLHEDRHSVA